MANVETANVVQAPGVLAADVDEHLVLLNGDLDYIGLDPIGRRTWELLGEPQTLSDLVATLITEYDVSEDQCRADVLAFLEQLAEHKLITVT
ncbi:MAG: PqqD family peptide modification chaperone [Actinomycetes bacterium]